MFKIIHKNLRKMTWMPFWYLFLNSNTFRLPDCNDFLVSRATSKEYFALVKTSLKKTMTGLHPPFANETLFIWSTKTWKNVLLAPAFSTLKVVSATFLLVCFACLKESTCGTRKNVFSFTLKAFFVSEIIKF